MTPQNRRDFLFESLCSIIEPLTTPGTVELRRELTDALQGQKSYLLPTLNDDAFEELSFEHSQQTSAFKGQTNFAIIIGVFADGSAESIRVKSNALIDKVERQFIKAFELVENNGVLTLNEGGDNRRITILSFGIVGNSPVKIQNEASAQTIGVFGTIDFAETML